MEYIENRIRTKIQLFESQSKHYARCHFGMMVAGFSCLLAVIVLNVLYLILPILWLIFASIVLALSTILIFFIDVFAQFEKKSMEYKNKASALDYEKNIYESKEKGFKGFAYRCEKIIS